MTIFLHSARTISRIFVFEAGGLRRSKAVEIRPAPYHFGGGQIQHASLCALAELCRQHGISEQTYYRWKAKYGGMESGEAKRLKQVEDENRKLKHVTLFNRGSVPRI